VVTNVAIDFYFTFGNKVTRSVGRYVYANEPNSFALQTFRISYYYSSIPASVF